MYDIGVDIDGTDSIGRLRIIVTDPQNDGSGSGKIGDLTTDVENTDTGSRLQVVEVETGVTNINLWLEWMVWTVTNLHKHNF